MKNPREYYNKDASNILQEDLDITEKIIGVALTALSTFNVIGRRILIPIITSQITGTTLSLKSLPSLKFVMQTWFLYWIMLCVIRLVYYGIKSYFFYRLDKKFKHIQTSMVLNIPISTTLSELPGNIVSNMKRFLQLIEKKYHNLYLHIFPNIAAIIFGFRKIYYTNITFFKAMVAWSIFYFLLQIVIQYSSAQYIRENTKLNSEQMGHLVEGSQVQLLIQCFNLRNFFYNRTFNKTTRKILSNQRKMILLNLIRYFLAASIALWWIDWLVIYRIAMKCIYLGKPKMVEDVVVLIGLSGMMFWTVHELIINAFAYYQNEFRLEIHKKFLSTKMVQGDCVKKENMISHSTQIEVSNLTIKHHNKVVLKDINFSLEKGESLVVMGPSGSGKTTLINAIIGLIETNSGRITINKKNVNKLKNLLQKIVYISQESQLISDSAINNILLGNISLNASHTKVKKVIKEFHLETVNLSQEVKKKSGGEKKRICIAQAMLKYNPGDLIICDEVTSNLDLNLAKDITDKLISTAKNHGSQIIFIEHSQIIAPKVDKVLFFETDKNSKVTNVILDTHKNLIQSNNYYQQYYNFN